MPPALTLPEGRPAQVRLALPWLFNRVSTGGTAQSDRCRVTLIEALLRAPLERAPPVLAGDQPDRRRVSVTEVGVQVVAALQRVERQVATGAVVRLRLRPPRRAAATAVRHVVDAPALPHLLWADRAGRRVMVMVSVVMVWFPVWYVYIGLSGVRIEQSVGVHLAVPHDLMVLAADGVLPRHQRHERQPVGALVLADDQLAAPPVTPPRQRREVQRVGVAARRVSVASRQRVKPVDWYGGSMNHVAATSGASV